MQRNLWSTSCQRTAAWQASLACCCMSRLLRHNRSRPTRLIADTDEQPSLVVDCRPSTSMCTTGKHLNAAPAAGLLNCCFSFSSHSGRIMTVAGLCLPHAFEVCTRHGQFTHFLGRMQEFSKIRGKSLTFLEIAVQVPAALKSCTFTAATRTFV